MSHKIIYTTLIVLLLIAIALFGVFWYLSNNANKNNVVAPIDNNALIAEENKIATKTPVIIPENKNTLPPVSYEEKEKAQLQQLVSAFVERYGSYSNQTDFENLTDLMPFMSQSLKNWAEKLKATAGAKRLWWNNKLKKELSSVIAYKQVYLPGHMDKPLFVIFCYSEGFQEPLVVITDIKITSFTDAWKVFFYYKKRWEAENFYRAVKQQFGMEKFLVLSFDKIRALLFLVMIAYHLLMKLQRKANEFLGMISIVFQQFCKKQQR